MDLTPLELHEIASRVDVNNMRKLGYHLGFEHGQVQRFELANRQNPSRCTGTEDMLMTWHSKGGTRDLLCQALRQVEQRRLAVQVESREFRVEPVAPPQQQTSPSAMPAVSGPVSQSNNLPRAEGVPSAANMEQILPELALDLTQEQFERLGLGLGFKNAEMNRFSASNFLTGRLTTGGTRDMLFEWRSRTPEPDQKRKLRAALLSLQLRELADKYFPQV